MIDRTFLNTIQKPEKLIERIVTASSSKNDLVLDPFAGTGTTLAVCEKLNRRFIGFEKDSSLVEVANKRLEDKRQEKAYLLFS